jgi:hypothetical protein
MIDPHKVIQDGEHEDAIRQSLRAEIARLRLTDAEREAVEWFADIDTGGPITDRHADTLRNLLARLYNK